MTMKGLSVEGVAHEGENSHFYGVNHTTDGEALIALAEVGANSVNKVTAGKMGDFRERLLWSKAPVVGNGTNGSSGSALTTSANGSTNWSVQDDAFPLPFFDRDTGEFQDSVQTRMKARMTINFGNPYRDKRGDSLIPEVFNNQRPPLNSSTGPQTPPASPPHDSSPSIEGEGEAIFAGRTSPPHESSKRKLSYQHSHLKEETENR